MRTNTPFGISTIGPAVLALCLASFARADMSPLEPDTNREGSDFARFNVVAPADCLKACDTNARCQAMTFVLHPDGRSGVCWLKRTMPIRSAASGMTSAVKQKGKVGE